MIVRSQFTSHEGWVTCVDWCVSREELFVSGGHDNLVKMWDWRSCRTPLYDLKVMYRVVQLNFTPGIELFYMLFDISLSIFCVASLKQHVEYFHFRCKIQLDFPVTNVLSIKSINRIES